MRRSQRGVTAREIGGEQVSRSAPATVPATSTALAAVLGAVALAGCGGSGPAADASPLGPARPSRRWRPAWAAGGSPSRAGHSPLRTRQPERPPPASRRRVSGPPAPRPRSRRWRDAGNPQALDKLATTVDPAHSSRSSCVGDVRASRSARRGSSSLPLTRSARATGTRCGAPADCGDARHPRRTDYSTLVGETATALKSGCTRVSRRRPAMRP